MFAWFIVWSFQFVIFDSVKKCLQNFNSIKKWMMVQIVDKNLWHYGIIRYLFAGFKTITLCSVYSIRFVKHAFSTKIWFVKTSTRIMKYKSWVIKSNPVISKKSLGMPLSWFSYIICPSFSWYLFNGFFLALLQCLMLCWKIQVF